MGEQTDGSVVGKVFLVSLFEYQCDDGIFPILRHYFSS